MEINPHAVITHLNIVQAWAVSAIDRVFELTPDHYGCTREWMIDGVRCIEKLLMVIDEQRETIDRLEHEIGERR